MESHVQTGGLKSCILPAALFPPVHWWCAFQAHTSFIDMEEMYVKQTIRNRMVISGVNGPIMLSVPVYSTQGIKTPIRDIRIEEGNWVKTYSRSIQSAYGRSAFFEYYFDDIEQILFKRHKHLIDLNLESMHWLRTKMKLPQPIAFVENEHSFVWDIDLRGTFEPSAAVPAHREYPQVFSDRMPFHYGLSAIDLLFNMGPRSIDYLLLKKNSED